MPWRRTVVAVGLVLASAGTSCSVVDRPDATDWDTRADQALTDASSEVATSRLALDTAARERTWSSYAVVVLAQAEEAMATVEDDLARLQVPTGRSERAEEVLAVLESAASAVSDARASAVEGELDDDATLGALDEVAAELDRATDGG
ncbi:hypothetical protein ASE01_07050 [Nocardioides sp. Root190]|nr:hypothetical protein ASE01_07050 [Nocardioides sp. Root190]